MLKLHRIRLGALLKRKHRPLWVWIRRKKSNPAAINPRHPAAPKSQPLPKSHVINKPSATATLEKQLIYWCHLSLAYAGKMTYTENWTLRQRFFSYAIGKFLSASADCSQFVATLLKWGGVTTVTSTDDTGTLLRKGKPLASPKAGCVAVWGPSTGAHCAFITEKTATGDWYCVGLGRQGAPDRNTLKGMNVYFASIGKPGVRFREFTAA